jgi:glutathione-specific gamma-glutamylcyclotransferase
MTTAVGNRQSAVAGGDGQTTADARLPTGDLWVFAYGSLMWRPGFAYRRCFCIYSVYHRGTPARLGLVLGLDRGGVCEGVAYRIAAGDAAAVRAGLRARELVNGVYREAVVPVELEHGPAEVAALAYIAERAHHTYAGRLPLSLQARLIRSARGLSGANLDYLVSTVRHLQEIGIRERELERLVTMVGPLAWWRARAQHTSPYAAALVRVEQRRPPPVRLDARAERGQFQHRQKAHWQSCPSARGEGRRGAVRFGRGTISTAPLTPP